MHIRDRIRELRRVPASELVPNKKNWQTHPQPQRDALAAVLADVGYADAALVRELDDGRLELIDGHLRRELAADALVPVLVLDVTEEEADKILATHDPLTALAGIDQEKFAALSKSVSFENPDIKQMLARLTAQQAQTPRTANQAECDVPESFQLVVECRTEEEQEALYERLKTEGYTCRVLVL